jgi:hypothetical protein
MRDEQFAAVPVHITSNPGKGCFREKRSVPEGAQQHVSKRGEPQAQLIGPR